VTRVRLAVQPRVFVSGVTKWPRFRFLEGGFFQELSFSSSGHFRGNENAYKADLNSRRFL